MEERSCIWLLKVRSTIQRYILWLALVTFLTSSSGCTSYRQAVLPGLGVVGTPIPANHGVSEGTKVRVTLYSGETISGSVTWLSSEELALLGRANYGYSDIVIRIENIEKIEVREQSDGRIERGWFIGLGVVAVVAFFVSLPIMREN